MTKEEILAQCTQIISDAKRTPVGTLALAKQFLVDYGGSKNAFLDRLNVIKPSAYDDYITIRLVDVIGSFKNYVERDLLRTVSLEREVQIDTVNDYLSQAQEILNNKSFHPAAACTLIGASLEEFLRGWLEEAGFDINSISKPSLDKYATQLRSMELISKGDIKDITAWGDKRNNAAHGHWEEVSDKKSVRLILDGVSHFIRTNT